MALSLEMSGIDGIDINKMYPMRLSNDTWDWLSFCSGSNSEKQWDYCKMTFIIGRGFAERQILKKVKMALCLEPSGIFW